MGSSSFTMQIFDNPYVIYTWKCINNVLSSHDGIVTKLCHNDKEYIPIISSNSCLYNVSYSGIVSENLSFEPRFCILRDNDFKELNFIFDKYNRSNYLGLITSQNKNFTYLSLLNQLLILWVLASFIFIILSIVKKIMYRPVLPNLLIVGNSIEPTPTPLRTYTSLKKSYLNNYSELDECSICIEPIQPDSVIGQLECSHSFHKECLEQWFLHSNRCPNCNGTPETASLI